MDSVADVTQYLLLLLLELTVELIVVLIVVVEAVVAVEDAALVFDATRRHRIWELDC